ncbi:MAG TPA: ABC transporter permease [Anaeromyxobacter sp.]|nr:ABC transporter permease [Anaeromyxobacter sp.]
MTDPALSNAAASPAAALPAPGGAPRSPFLQIALARLRSFYREPEAVFWSFGFPILLTIALGIAFRAKPPDPVRAAVVAGPRAEAARAALAAGPAMDVQVLGEEAAGRALRGGQVAIVVVPGDPPTYRFDPTNPDSRLAHAVVDDLLEGAAGRRDVLAPRVEHKTEPGARYVDFLVPGLLGMNIMSSGMWGVGWVIVEDRQKKLLKRLVATPMRRSQYLLAFVAMRMLFLLVEVPVLVGFAMIFFGTPLRGRVVDLSALMVLGAMAFAGMGLLVGCRARNSQTVAGLINLVMMPMFVLSGVFFSSQHFPAVVQPAIRVLPLTALNDGLRAVMNDGTSIAALWPEVAVLAVVTAVSFGLALRWFRWT